MRPRLVSTTRVFFNKVNQAESLNQQPAVEFCFAAGDDSVIKKFPSAVSIPVLGTSCTHCDLSVTTSGGCSL